MERVPAKSASFPKATHRCHSVRDSHVPASFFQDVLVASENTAMFVALLTFFSASLPRKPIRVILLRYIRFPCSARLSRAPGSEWARLPRPEVAFLGDRYGEPSEVQHGGKRQMFGRGQILSSRVSRPLHGLTT